MTAIGLFHIRHNVKGPTIGIKIALYVYSLIRMVFTTTNVCLYFPGIFEWTGHNRMMVLISTLFYGKDLLNVLICFYVFERKTVFFSFMQYWRKIKKTNSFDKVIYGLLFLSLMALSAPNMLFIPSFLRLYTSISTYKGMFGLFFYYIDYEHAMLMRPYLTLFGILISLTDALCILFFCGVCIIVYREFSISNESLEKNLSTFKRDTSYAVFSRQCKDSSHCLDTVSLHQNNNTNGCNAR